MDPGKTTVYVLRVDTARRCFFCLGCMFGQRNDFFWAGGGGRAGQKFAVFPTTRFPVLAPRLLLRNAEHRAKHEEFCWKGIKMEMTERF